MAKKLVWLCLFTGTQYDLNDPAIAGYGNPPSSPQTPPGMGNPPMQLTSVDVSEVATKTTEKK